MRFISGVSFIFNMLPLRAQGLNELASTILVVENNNRSIFARNRAECFTILGIYDRIELKVWHIVFLAFEIQAVIALGEVSELVLADSEAILSC